MTQETTSTFQTSSTNAIYGLLRRALLEYEGTGELAGMTAGDANHLEDRLWQVQAQDSADGPTFPYATMRLMDQKRSGAYNGMRKEATLEVFVYGKPTSQLELVEEIADLFEQAMTGFVKIVQGLTFSREGTRTTLPRPPAPADSEVVTVMLHFDLVLWPNLLTRIATNAPTS